MDSLSSDLELTSTPQPPPSSSSSSSLSSPSPQSSPPPNSPPPPESEKSNPKSPPPRESTPSPPSPEYLPPPEAEPPPPPQESPHSPAPKNGSSTSAPSLPPISPPTPPSSSHSASPNLLALPSPSSPQANSVSSLVVTPPPQAFGSRKLSPPSSHSGGGSPPPPPSSSSENRVIIVGVVLCGFLILASILIFMKCRSRKKKRNQYYMDPPRGPKGLMGTAPCGVGPYPSQGYVSSGDYSSGFSDLQSTGMTPISPNVHIGMNQSSFSYDELAAATGGFSQANMLGQGGFGYVHKGVLADGKEVAVKSLKSGSGQGEREFRAEVEIISRVHHRNLVSLVGYCIAEGRRMLVYEFVPNKTLEYHLHGSGRPTLDWATRLRIALGSAKGLSYLHEDCHPRIIHRDIKSANILIDYEFEAKVADFGLAKLSNDNNTHVSTRIMGTFGYLAPEYASSGKLTEKSDVFSFGVMLLELVTGSKPVDNDSSMEDSLVDWARPILSQALEDGTYDGLVDPRLEDNFVPHEMGRMVACAAASICNSAKRRPKMSQIVRVLEGDLSPEDLNNVNTTGSNASSQKSRSSSTYDTSAYNADLVKFRKMVLMTNQEHKSKE